jgi:four helix bundle protein
MFDFEKLEVYGHLRHTVKKVHAFLIDKKELDSHLHEQLRNASTKMLLNLSEGTGRINNNDKREFYTAARSAAFEAVTVLQLMYDLHMLTESEYLDFYADFETASKMLLGMVRSFSN